MERLTQYGHGGGCACKIPPGELEDVLAGLLPAREGNADLLVGADGGDDAAVVAFPPDDGEGATRTGIVATADFFTPLLDDPYAFGQVAAANALSDVYAMGGTPLVAVNLLAWPRETLPFDLAREVLRGGVDKAAEAGCHVGGGHSIDDPEPKYGMAVTGIVELRDLMRLDAGKPGVPLSLTKPLGVGVLNCRHKATGETFPHAVASMSALNRDASRAAVAAGIACATDVTGFGLLGHLFKLARASGVTAVVDSAAVPMLDGARESAEAGYINGGTRRNLAWVEPHTAWDGVSEIDRLLLADAQTSGGLLVAGEIPGASVIGELIPATERTLVIR